MHHHRGVRFRALLLAVVGVLVAGTTLMGLGPTVQAAPERQQRQVVTWGASADRTGGTFTDQTVRNLVHTSIGGPNVRISLSNAFGDRAVTFDSVYVGVHDAGAALVPGSNREVLFSGSPTVTVPAGAEVLSDPLDWTVPADTTIAVSVHVVGASGALTGHNLAMQHSYAGPGDVAADEGGAAFTTRFSRWVWVEAVVVDAPKQVETVAFLGDSITDGHSSTVNANHRWPDYLADRLASRPLVHQHGILNEGISGNRVLTDGAGVSAQARFDRDVLSQPGVETVVLLEGINDIGGGQATSADQLIAAYQQLIRRAHARGVCIVGGTLTPFEGAGYYSEAKEAIRSAVNEWVRTSGEFDAVIDFDAATRDPANPRRFLPAYDIGDHLHPNDAGYEAMAAAVDPAVLECDR